MIDKKKKRSVFSNVSLRIEHSKGEANCYTIYKPQAVSTNSAQEPISDRLNRKYKVILHGWLAEKRQRENGAFDMVQQIVGGLVGDNVRASNGANGGNDEGGRCRRDDSGRI
uniref:Uncharacterized protein n=1 Tax=Solanum tuberosum TaxID=4113 RepID=M1DTI0_SOLTU